MLNKKNMWILFEFILTGIIFFAVGYFSWWFTEKDKVPNFLDFRPFSCRLCLNFWLLVAIYVALGISFNLWVMLIAGVILAILNAIAMWVNQRNKTIKLEDYDKI